MEYSKIISVTGLSGLYELVGSKTDGAIVRSLEDKSTKFVSSRLHNFSHLESIEIFTTGDNTNLVDLLQAMDTNTEPKPAEKDAPGIKKYFEKVYPELDFDRVYTSDMKKMFKWYGILKANNIELKIREVESDEEAVEEPKIEVPEVVQAVEETPKKKKAAKKKAE